MSSGDVSVGIKGLESRAEAMKNASTSQPTVVSRLLATPATLAPRSMCIDLVTTADNSENTRILLVIKRKSSDGLVTSITEEVGHRKVSTV